VSFTHDVTLFYLKITPSLSPVTSLHKYPYPFKNNVTFLRSPRTLQKGGLFFCVERTSIVNWSTFLCAASIPAIVLIRWQETNPSSQMVSYIIFVTHGRKLYLWRESEPFVRSIFGYIRSTLSQENEKKLIHYKRMIRKYCKPFILLKFLWWLVSSARIKMNVAEMWLCRCWNNDNLNSGYRSNNCKDVRLQQKQSKTKVKWKRKPKKDKSEDIISHYSTAYLKIWIHWLRGICNLTPYEAIWSQPVVSEKRTNRSISNKKMPHAFSYWKQLLTSSSVASTKFWGRQIFWIYASNSISFGAWRLAALNDKIC